VDLAFMGNSRFLVCRNQRSILVHALGSTARGTFAEVVLPEETPMWLGTDTDAALVVGRTAGKGEPLGQRPNDQISLNQFDLGKAERRVIARVPVGRGQQTASATGGAAGGPAARPSAPYDYIRQPPTFYTAYAYSHELNLLGLAGSKTMLVRVDDGTVTALVQPAVAGDAAGFDRWPLSSMTRMRSIMSPFATVAFGGWGQRFAVKIPEHIRLWDAASGLPLAVFLTRPFHDLMTQPPATPAGMDLYPLLNSLYNTIRHTPVSFSADGKSLLVLVPEQPCFEVYESERLWRQTDSGYVPYAPQP